MVKINELSKVENAVKAIINNKLETNCDDTLLEKFYTLLRLDPSLQLNDKKSILKLLETSIDCSLKESNELTQKESNERTLKESNEWTQMENNLLTKIRICGSLLTDRQLFESQSNCLNFVKLLAINIINSNNSSLKFAYFKCLNDICCHSLGSHSILSIKFETNSSLIKSFPHLLLIFLNRTESRFIEQEVRQLFIRLLNHSLIITSDNIESDCLENFTEVFKQIISPLNPLSVDIIRESLLSLTAKREFINKYEITNILINNIDFWIKNFEEKLYLLCETLGLCVDSNEKAFIVIECLLKQNQLKPLIGFLTYLIGFDNSFSDKWMSYAMPLFAINNELIDRFDLSISEKTLIKSFSNKNTIDYALKQIFKVDFKSFNTKQIHLIIDTLFNYIKLIESSRGMRKTVVQILSIIEKIGLNSSLDNDLIENLFTIYAELLIILSNDLKLIVLKSLRLLIDSKEWPKSFNYENSAINELVRELNNILKSNTINDNNWEIIDSVLEVIYCVSLSHNEILFTKVCPELIPSVFSIWAINKDNLCSTLRTTLVSVLIIIDITASKEDLMKFGVQNHCDLQSILSFLFNEELMVRNIIIKTLNDSISLLLKIETQNTTLFYNIIEALCKVSIVDLDDDLQSNVLNFLHKLFALLLDKKEFSHLISFFYKSGFFHTLYHILNSGSILYKVKIKCIQIIDYLRDRFDSVLGKSLSTTLESIITQDLSLHSMPDIYENNVFSINEIKCLESKIIINFILNYDTKLISENGSEDFPNLSVLDDILSVSQIDSDILIDCY
jgi:hypothetical protein